MSNSVMDFSNNYTVKAYYKETIAGKWLPLTEQLNGIQPIVAGQNHLVKVYDINGVLLQTFQSSHLANEYILFQDRLPRGVYLICDGDKTRKYVKGL